MYAIISSHTSDYQSLADWTWPNKEEYAEKHGYLTYCKTEGHDPNLKWNHDKLYLIRDCMEINPDVEWFWWLGCDTLITNFNIKLETLTDNDYNVIVATDGNGMNNDSCFFRNSPEGRSYLDYLIEVFPRYATHHFLEQQAMIESYDMPEWKPLIKIIPQYLINSHDCWPNEHQPDPKWVDKFGNRSWWEPGDLLVHWPGSSLETRLKRQVPHYISKVIK